MKATRADKDAEARAEADLAALLATRIPRCLFCKWARRVPDGKRYASHLAAKVGTDSRVSWEKIAVLLRAAYGDGAPPVDSVRRHFRGRCAGRE